MREMIRSGMLDDVFGNVKYKIGPALMLEMSHY
jgi:hypothetical protein